MQNDLAKILENSDDKQCQKENHLNDSKEKNHH